MTITHVIRHPDFSHLNTVYDTVSRFDAYSRSWQQNQVCVCVCVCVCVREREMGLNTTIVKVVLLTDFSYLEKSLLVVLQMAIG